MTTRDEVVTAGGGIYSGPKAILAIDIGGTGVKGAVVSPEGKFISEKVRVSTPELQNANQLWDLVSKIASQTPPFEAMSVGFPGVLRRGVIRSCPTLGCDALLGHNVETTLHERFKVPVRALNDASMQALAAISGDGIEIVITLGTGFGFAMFEEGRLGPRFEMSTHPIHDGKTYNKYVGDAAFKKQGTAKWRERVKYVIEELQRLTDFDTLYIGGGNSRHLKVSDLSSNIKIVSNELGIQGGAWLWRDNGSVQFKHWTAFPPVVG